MRILGLDIGSSSIKAVELNTAFGRTEILEYHEREITSGVSALESARELILNLKKKPDKIVTNLRSNRVTIRNLKLPTRDKKAIKSSIQFELEDDLPFEADQLSYEYVNLGTVGSETSIHVAATTKTNIAELLALMAEHDLNPDILTTESCAYRALFKKISQSLTTADHPTMLLQLGHERSTISIQNHGNPVVCREINWGSREMSVALSKRYNLPFEAAEKAKIESGFVLPLSQLDEVSEEQRDFASTVFESLLPLIRDIKQADLSCKNVTGQRVGQLYLSGPTALLPGLAATFSEELKMSATILRPLSSMGSSGVTYSEQTDVRFTLALGLALCATSSEKNALINFRKGEFVKKSSGRGNALSQGEIDFNQFYKPFKIALLTFFIANIILFIETNLYDEKLSSSNTQLEKAIKSYFTGISPTAVKNHMNNVSGLKKSIDAEVARERQLSKLFDPDPSSPFEYLKTLSQQVPKDVVTDLMKFTVGSSISQTDTSRVETIPTELEFLVTSPAVAERLKELILSKHADLTASPISEVTTKDGLKKLKLTFAPKGKK